MTRAEAQRQIAALNRDLQVAGFAGSWFTTNKSGLTRKFHPCETLDQLVEAVRAKEKL